MATLTLIILKKNTSPAPKMTNNKAQYNPQKIEQEAQEYWDINNSFSVTEDKKKEKLDPNLDKSDEIVSKIKKILD